MVFFMKISYYLIYLLKIIDCNFIFFFLITNNSEHHNTIFKYFKLKIIFIVFFVFQLNAFSSGWKNIRLLLCYVFYNFLSGIYEGLIKWRGLISIPIFF